MAMHVALARALWSGATEPSVAWPGVAPPLYPRGFSGLITLFWSLGPGRAGLLAWSRLRAVRARGRPHLHGARDETPLHGGRGHPLPRENSSGRLRVGRHRHRPRASSRPPRRFEPRRACGRPAHRVSAGLLLSGAGAVHPMGALIGALVAGATIGSSAQLGAWGDGARRPRCDAHADRPCGADPLHGRARVDRELGPDPRSGPPGRPLAVPLSVWLAFLASSASRGRSPWSWLRRASSHSAGPEAGRSYRGRRPVGRGDSCRRSGGPGAGTLLYPVRLLPLLALVTAPLLDAALARLGTERRPSARGSSSRSRRRSTSAGTSARARSSRWPISAYWSVQRRARRTTL